MRLARPTSLLFTSLLHLYYLRPVLADLTSLANQTFNPLRDLQQIPLSSQDIQTSTANMTRLAPVISISHGGGPMPLLGDPSHAALIKSLQTRVPQILKLGTAEQPRAIVLVTAHWNTEVVSISSAAKHELLYDYYGFPDAAYEIKYDAPGSPEVARLVRDALVKGGVEARMDGERGWDHGVFVPMTLIHPQATIPIIQLSVLQSESPSLHFKIGRALAPLRAENIAIIGSGFASLHNLNAMFSGQVNTRAFKELNEEWSRQVAEAVETEDVEERGKRLEGWRNMRGSWDMHPKGGAEHFLPFVVCAGAGGEGKAGSWTDGFMGLGMWSFWWE